MKYTVDCQYHGHVKITVHAIDEEDAENKAYEVLDNMKAVDILDDALWDTIDVREVKDDD